MKQKMLYFTLGCGFLIHLLILKAAFDIYFSSPLDHGMRPIKSTNSPPAERVVLFVADGIRSDAIFKANNTKFTPNLNYIKDNRGSWGISHTRVPTESRPGHVAMLAGIYEDPSAILKGWTVNPVDFDSIINQSTNAWCWGAPSVLNMFNRDNISHIHLYTYDAHLEDFGNRATIELDKWVFHHVLEFFEENSNSFELRQSGNLFFLHLLGMDTVGHGFKPGSKQYTNNVEYVDQYVKYMENLFEEIFPDSSTAYVFTADHGMTNWGSHGSGTPDETETPIIVWGAGIKRNSKRLDIRQVDIAPFISALLGINYPINSLGQLPEAYFNVSKDILVEMIMNNVKQLLEIFNIKRFRTMANTLKYIPYHGITTKDIKHKFDYLQTLIEMGNFEQFKIESEEVMRIFIVGSEYYHNYYQLPLLIAISIGLVAWMCYLITFNITISANLSFGKAFYITQFILFAIIYVTVVVLVKIQALPLMHYVYFLFPVLMIQVVTFRYHHILEALRLMKRFGWMKSGLCIFAYLFILMVLVQSFYYRSYMCYILLAMIGLTYWSDALRNTSALRLKFGWLVFCSLIAIFLHLEVMKTSFHLIFYLLGWVFWVAVFLHFLTWLEFDPTAYRVKIQLFQFIVTPLWQVAAQYGYLRHDSPVKYLAWIWAAFPIIWIFFTSTKIFTRLSSIFLGFGVYYLMVTTNFEPLFLICFVVLLLLWLALESRSFGHLVVTRNSFARLQRDDNKRTVEDFRRAFFFIAFIFLGFFGTGNIASLNSFDPMWLRCFLTIFSPFKMSALIILRISIPVIFTSCIFRAINLYRRGNTLDMFSIVLLYSDVMLLQLLFSITNIGSWLDIGMSLSQFIVMDAFVLILLVVHFVGYLFTTKTIR